MGRLRAASLLLALGACGIAGAHGPTDIRLYPGEEYTRIVFEADSLPGYRLSRLSDPERLVLDVYFDHGDELLAKINERTVEDARYLSAIRAARFDEGRLRVVFDLSDEVKYSLFSLDPLDNFGHRVVLDVAPARLAEENPGLLADLGFSGQPAKPLAPAPQPRPRRKGSGFVVVIDPGHGGDDPGALNKWGQHEKHIVLDISKRVQRLLSDHPDVSAHLTRDRDIFLPLASRVRAAHRLDADLFMSIHADSFTSSRPSGSSVFVLSRKGASSNLARKLAEQENLADMVGGINTAAARTTQLDQSLEGLFRYGKERASRQYATMVKESLGDINSSHGKDIHSAGFAVLKSPSIPSVLIEVGFLSNPEDARLLGQEAFRQRVADQIAAAALRYYDTFAEEAGG